MSKLADMFTRGHWHMFLFFFPHQFLTYHSMTPTQLWWYGDLCKGASHERSMVLLTSHKKFLSWRSCERVTVCELLLFHTLELWLTDPLCRKEALRENLLLGEKLRMVGWAGVNLVAMGCSMTCYHSKMRKDLTFCPVNMSDMAKFRQK